MTKYLITFAAIFALILSSCNDDIDLIIPHPTNITFEELQIPERFSHVTPDGGFSVGGGKF